MNDHASEVQAGVRFRFGANWQRFLTVLNDQRIEDAKQSLQRMLGVRSLAGRTFLDIGSGSGLFSLAACALGAKVHSFDYDPQSVACTAELKRRYFPAADWVVESGSVLDQSYLRGLGRFDVVYSWGVLHHTGQMWQAFANVAPLVKPAGSLFIAIYNRQPRLSAVWTVVKRTYNRLPRPLQWLADVGFVALFVVVQFLFDVLRARNPMRRYRGTRQRGMNFYYDIVDWIGGWPFEVATPEEVFRYFSGRGFVLQELVTCAGRHGCNEFVFHAAGEP